MIDYERISGTTLNEKDRMKLLSDILKVKLFISVAMYPCDEKKEIQDALTKAGLILARLNDPKE